MLGVCLRLIVIFHFSKYLRCFFQLEIEEKYMVQWEMCISVNRRWWSASQTIISCTVGVCIRFDGTSGGKWRLMP